MNVSSKGLDRQVHQRVHEALSQIASARELDGKLVVDVPVMYPSGATAVIEVVRNREVYWVSDMGFGRVEAEYMAAQDYYSPAATRIAEDMSVQFDGNAIFALQVPSPRLEAAIVCVANASVRASSEAIRAASEAVTRRQNEGIYDRVVCVFGPKHVARTAEVSGRHAQWEAHNLIVFPNGHRAIFEAMSSHQNSVSSKFLMFSDIRAADRETSLNAVVRGVDKLDEKGQMVGDVANIVDLDASDEDYKRYALAS